MAFLPVGIGGGPCLVQLTLIFGLMKGMVSVWLLMMFGLAKAQLPLQEEVRSKTVMAIKFYKLGDQRAYPVINMNEIEKLELHFDDFQFTSRNYFYTFVLCNADWTPAIMSSMEYLKGFTQNRITQYRASSGTPSRYMHYQVRLPVLNCMPTKSGNYLLKVFENGDTSKLAFSKRFLVLNTKATVAPQVMQPFAQEHYLKSQKIAVTLSLKGFQVANPAAEIKVAVLQNNRWDNARFITNPTFMRPGGVYEYSDENALIFEGGKEWRWVDLRSFRLQSERVASINYNVQPYQVFVRADTVRSPIRYFYYNDINGSYAISHLENINPWWQGDIAKVNFTLLPSNAVNLDDYNIYIFGEMSQYQLNESTLLKWNDALGAYEVSLTLKNGFYDYCYISVPKKKPEAPATLTPTEGSSWEAENQYTVLVYYRPFGARHDEVIGYSTFNSLTFRQPGFR